MGAQLNRFEAIPIAGQMFPYEDHERYFAKVMQPRLGPMARFVGSLADEVEFTVRPRRE